MPDPLGPLFRFELARVSRRGTLIWMRCAYGALLLLAMYFTCERWHHLADFRSASFDEIPQGSQAAARFAEMFFETFVFTQFWVLVLFTPGFLAGGVAEERERGTLDLLFASQLRNREIVLGKLFARLAVVGSVMLTGLPVMSLTLVLGGVDEVQLLSEFAAAGLTLLAVGSICIAASVVSINVRAALSRSYLLVGLLFIWTPCCGIGSAYRVTPFGLLLEYVRRADPTGSYSFAAACGTALVIYASICLALTLAALVVAMGRLRRVVVVPRPPDPDSPVMDFGGPLEWLIRPSSNRWRERDPLLWRELQSGGVERDSLRGVMRFFSGLLSGFVYVFLVMSLVVVGWLVVVLASQLRASEFRELTRAVSVPTMCVVALFAGLSAARAISQERERRTLESLLSVPESRTQILFAKWLGCLLRTWKIIAIIGVFWIAGVLFANLSFGSLLLAFASFHIHLAWIVTLGLCLSQTCSTSLRAMMAMLMVLLAIGLAYEWLWPLGCWPNLWWNAINDRGPPKNEGIFFLWMDWMFCFISGAVLWMWTQRSFDRRPLRD